VNPSEDDRHIPLSREQVIAHNLRLHETTAAIYDRIHYYLRNRVEQAWLWGDLRRIHGYLQGTGGEPIHYLDLGCGTGNLTLKLLSLGAYVIGVDLSSAMLEVLRDKANRAGTTARLETLRGTADDPGILPADRLAAVHAVCISSLLHHLYDYQAPLRRLRLLCPRVRLVYVTHEPVARQTLRPPGPIRREVNRAVRGLDILLTDRLHGAPPTADDPIADYHYFRDGVDEAAIAALLAAQGLDLPLIRRQYNMRRTSVASALDNLLLRPLRSDIFPITMFTLAVASRA